MSSQKENVDDVVYVSTRSVETRSTHNNLIIITHHNLHPTKRCYTPRISLSSQTHSVFDSQSNNLIISHHNYTQRIFHVLHSKNRMTSSSSLITITPNEYFTCYTPKISLSLSLLKTQSKMNDDTSRLPSE